jgi:molybdenum cofactor biosynthesis enzyme MoaA
MPLDGVKLTPNESLLTFEERKRLISIFSQYGVNKIRFTGGEPTINKTLPDLVRHCRSIPTMKSVGITTNGILLKNQLDRLCDAGLTHVNISLDSLDPDKFAQISRRDRKGLAVVLSSIYAAASRNLSVKVNCVLMRHLNYNEIASFVRLGEESGVDIRFIELMPFDENKWDPKDLVPYYEAIDHLQTHQVWKSCIYIHT